MSDFNVFSCEKESGREVSWFCAAFSVSNFFKPLKSGRLPECVCVCLCVCVCELDRPLLILLLDILSDFNRVKSASDGGSEGSLFIDRSNVLRVLFSDKTLSGT